jgi:hypothetical protein
VHKFDKITIKAAKCFAVFGYKLQEIKQVSKKIEI